MSGEEDPEAEAEPAPDPASLRPSDLIQLLGLGRSLQGLGDDLAAL